jgi:hypothetical protein
MMTLQLYFLIMLCIFIDFISNTYSIKRYFHVLYQSTEHHTDMSMRMIDKIFIFVTSCHFVKSCYVEQYMFTSYMLFLIAMMTTSFSYQVLLILLSHFSESTSLSNIKSTYYTAASN